MFILLSTCWIHCSSKTPEWFTASLLFLFIGFGILPHILWRNGTRSWPDPPSLFHFMKLVWNLCSILVLRMWLILRFLAAGFFCDFSLLNFDIYYLRKLTRTHVAFQEWRLAPSKQCNKLGTWWQLNQLLNKFTWKSKICQSNNTPLSQNFFRHFCLTTLLESLHILTHKHKHCVLMAENTMPSSMHMCFKVSACYRHANPRRKTISTNISYSYKKQVKNG
jgi:hypothetical protein